ncbi:MAG: helix-turn-helix domain-containing protein [Chlamydiae bacterium]|nr:helix-turn-helix domain-containing protein [Chlamydiota bacterium]
MEEELKQLGLLFKTKREEKNLTLKEVENSTSIRSNYLEAIEEGHGKQALSSVYILGFIRQYANFLGLEVEKIMSDYPHVFKTTAQKHDFAYGIGTLEVRGSSGGGVKWLPSLIWAGASAVVLVLLWYFAKNLGLV